AAARLRRRHLRRARLRRGRGVLLGPRAPAADPLDPLRPRRPPARRRLPAHADEPAVSPLDPARPALLVDFKSPYAWLAGAPRRAPEAGLGFALDGLPPDAAPLQPPTPDRDGDDRGTRHRRIRTRYWEADLRRYAESRGLDLGDVYRTPDTARASLALLF